MDGNRRAGEADFGNRLQGHAAGVVRIEEVVRRASEHGISFVTLYAFSTENWKRSETEVETLFSLFRSYFHEKLSELVADGVRVCFIGRRDRLPADILVQMAQTEASSQGNTRITLIIALDYGGRDELVRAFDKLQVSGSIATEATISEMLDTADVPDPDLIIRTGGEKRLSGFLLWQAAYAELYFTDTLWPHFTVSEFDRALAWFQTRERRIGK